MNWDVMNGTAGAGYWVAYLLGFGAIMLVGWLLRRKKP